MRLLRLTFVTAVAVTIPLVAGGRSEPHATVVAAVAAPGRISEEQAIARAVNDLRATKDGVSLRHPRHRVEFTAEGVRFVPRRGPVWRWRLDGAAAASPTAADNTVVYRRGDLVERYLPGEKSVEQQFVLERRRPTVGDLTISGRVETEGRFRATAEGWSWSTEAGAVTLGDVTVFDAAGKKLPARMSAGRSFTRIVVDGAALARAAYPVTVDPEIGANDFRISDMLWADTRADASNPAVAYNATNNEYLVVWGGIDQTPPFAGHEIFGQRLNAATGAEVGTNDFRISDLGPEGNTNFYAVDPAVSYNATNNEYLVVWAGDDDTPPLVDNEDEIFGQRLNAATGAELGTNDFQISDLGPDGNPSFDASYPAVASGQGNEYLVVWSGDDATPPLVDDELEIFGQRFSPDVPTAVSLASFTGAATASGIHLRWRTGSEGAALGFHVWRNGKRLTRTLIPARMRAGGASYGYLDRGAPSSRAYVYRLEVVRPDGRRSWFEPVWMGGRRRA